jgi:hypothetical protein
MVKESMLGCQGITWFCKVHYNNICQTLWFHLLQCRTYNCDTYYINIPILTLTHVAYYSTFSDLAIIKLFLEMSNFAEIICLKGWKFLNYKWKEKYKSWWKYMSFLVEASPPLQSKYPIIDKNILSYKLVEHYFYPFLQKKIKIKCCQRFRVQRTCCLYLLLKFHKLLFLPLKWILKNKIIIHDMRAKPEKV